MTNMANLKIRLQGQEQTQVERCNRTLLGMLRTLPEDQKSNWKEFLNKLMYTYNVMKQQHLLHFTFRIGEPFACQLTSYLV